MCLKHKFKSSESGQTLIEYIFLLSIVIIVLLGAVYRFNTGFADFADKFFGDENSYIACLIKEGLLPGDTGGQCPKPKLTFEAGKKLPTNTSGVGGTSINPTNPNSATGSKNAKSPAQSSSGAGGAGRANEKSSNIPAGKFAGNNGKYIGDSGAGESGEGSNQKATGTGGVASRGGGGSGSSGGGSNQQDLKTRYVPFNKGDNISANKGNDSIPLNERDKKTLREISAEKQQKTAKDIEVELTFGNIFRYLLIAALIFAIIFFVGSQLLAISRGNKR
ncbi:MAG: hypothetical protein SGI74_03045 [Oligoflexia bacterium]|nr:hypothetical protein [Oligoflexia bacterium]